MGVISVKRRYLIGAVILVILCIIVPGFYHFLWGSGRALNRLNPTRYEMDVTFNPNSKKIECGQRTTYINNTKTDLWTLYFHVYPNAFKSEDKPVFPAEEMDRAYPNGFSPGFMEFGEVLIDGRSTAYALEGYSDDKLMIPLDEALKPGDRLDIYLEYSVAIPNSPGRFGYSDNTYNLGNWYPILCVYDERGWNLEPYHTLGDPFYSDVSSYDVKIIAPLEFVIASTGEVVKVVRESEQNIWELKGQNVRDFAWVASQRFQASSVTVGETTVYSYYHTEEGGEKALEFGASALEIFNGLFGVYPYRNLSIVQTDFFIGGMEYPRLVMIDESLYDGNQDDWLELVTVHEVAHQWWYGLVGNDEVNDSWLDEGLTEYSTILYYGQRYGRDEEEQKYQTLINKGKLQLFRIYRDSGETDETIHRPLYQFKDWVEYDSLVYGKGAIMFHELRQEMGDTAFFGVLKEYFKENMLQNAKPEDLYRACEKITGKAWDDFFRQWLYDDYGQKAS
ncbi:MAG TPA: M1 family metallopeptidase [Clostridia bacterium]|nr:M1 family metallopeptidase [Clostridia bacterium]